MREIILKIRNLNDMMTLTSSNNFIGYEGEHLETVLKIQDNNIFDGFGIFIKFQNEEDVYISERLTIKDGFYEFSIPQLLLKKGRIDAQLLLTENNPNKSDDIQIIKESSIFPFICKENIEQKDAQTISDNSKGLFVLKVNGDGGSYLGDDGKYHTLAPITDFISELKEKLNNGELKGDKGDKGDQGEQGLKGDKGENGKDGVDGLTELKQNVANKFVEDLENHLYYATEEVKLRTHRTLHTSKYYLIVPQGTLLLVKKKTNQYNEILSLYITIIGSCTHSDVEYKYGIHEYVYGTLGGRIYNSFVIDTQSIETAITNLETNKQDNLTAGAGITITDNGVISSDVGLQIVVLKDNEDLPNIPQENTIYFKRNTETDDESTDWYEEYIWVNNWWESIGTTKVDLTDYALKTEVEAKQNAFTAGRGLSFSTPNTLINTLEEVSVSSDTDDIEVTVSVNTASKTKKYNLAFNADNYIKKSELPKEVQIGGSEPTDENIVLWFDENDSGYTVQSPDGDNLEYGSEVIDNE